MKYTKPFWEAKMVWRVRKGIVLSALLLTGCQDIIKDPPFERKTYELDHHTATYVVHFAPKSLTVKPHDLYELEELLNPEMAGKVSVHVTLPRPRTNEENKKIQAVKTALIKNGLKERRIHIKAKPLAIKNHAVEIELDTYHVIPPVCGDWHFPLGDARGAMMYPDYSCSTTRNFILMLEDPKVLWKGEVSSGHDTNRDLKAIKDFQSGKPLKLKEESTDNVTQDQGYGQSTSNNG